MREYIRRAGAAVALGAVMLLGACGGDDERAGGSLANDSALSSDLQLAGADTGVTPQLQDVPVTPQPDPAGLTDDPAPAPAPRATAPRPTTTPRSTTPRTTTPRTTTPATTGGTQTGGTSGGAVGSIGAGTALALTSDSRVCTKT
jgi:hypothetical protein